MNLVPHERRGRFFPLLLMGLAMLLNRHADAHDLDSDKRYIAQTNALRGSVDTLVVIYLTGHSFDNVFGQFPGATGLSEVTGADGKPNQKYVLQVDRDGSALTQLPPVWGGVTFPGVSPSVPQLASAGLPNAPLSLEAAFTLDGRIVVRDSWARFFENQMQINQGKMNGFAAWSDSGAMAMSHVDYTNSGLGKLAREFTIEDNYFQGAFGGDFLNYQYAVCACAPVYPDADLNPAKPSIAVLEQDSGGRYLPRLVTSTGKPVSALDAPPHFALSGNIAPINYFDDGLFHAINTMQPPYQPSGNAPAVYVKDDGLFYANPLSSTTLPPQTSLTIGDKLDARAVSWAWYAGAWNQAMADGRRPASDRRTAIYAPQEPNGAPDFQAHHQPFNYFLRFDPVVHADLRKQKLRDWEDFKHDIDSGTLPSVSFYVPQGNLNQHSGYTNLASGDGHIWYLIDKLRSSKQWTHMVVVIAYNSFGGQWDHVPPPAADSLGPGTRVPAIVISPFSHKGLVDHTPNDSGSILRLISRRFDLDLLPGLVERKKAMAAHGNTPLGDLTTALELPKR
jgi:acid phosphatase